MVTFSGVAMTAAFNIFSSAKWRPRRRSRGTVYAACAAAVIKSGVKAYQPHASVSYRNGGIAVKMALGGAA